MAYLHINGYQVKTRQGGEISFEETFGRRGYSPGGNYQFGRNHIGRAWRFTTIPLPRDEAQALANMINMLGDSWKFDLSAASDGVAYVTDNTSSEVYSDKRRIPQTAEAECTIAAAYGADGARVYDWNGNAYGAFEGSTGSLLVEPATTNLFAATTYDCSDHTVFIIENASGSASKADDTASYWEGSSSVKVITGANTGDGLRTPNVTSGFTAGVSTTVSVFVKGASGGEQVRIALQETLSGGGGAYSTIGTPSSFTLPATGDAWTRIYTTETTSATAVGLRVLVLNAVASAQTWYVDGFQMEEPTDGFPTAPIDPGSDPYGSGNGARPAGVLDFDTFVSGYTNGFTVATWFNVQKTGTGASQYIFDTGDGAPRAVVYLDASDQPTFQLVHSFSGSLLAVDSALSAGWHHLCAVYDRSANTAYLYVDGVLGGSDSTWSGARQYFDIENSAGDLSLGSAGTAGNNTAPGPIGSLQIYPFAMPAAMANALYNSGTDTRLPPGLTPLGVHGDFLGTGERWVKCYGQVNRVSNVPFQDATLGWQAGGATVDFTLYEATGK
jgi:hypothetical protein